MPETNLQNSIINQGGKVENPGIPDGMGEWFSTVPEPIRGEKVWETYKGKPIDDVFKTFVESQKMIGSSIRLPKEDATPKDKAKAMNDVWNKLGRPEAADKYDVEEVLKPFREQGIVDDEALKSVLGEAHTLGVTQEQMKGLLKFHFDSVTKNVPKIEELNKQTREKLVGEMGEGLFKRGLSNGFKAVMKFGGEEYIAWLDKTGAGSMEPNVKFLMKVGNLLAENGIIDPQESHGGVKNASSAKDKISKIMNDKSHAYFNKMDPNHDGAVEEMLELHQIAYGKA